MNDSTIEKQLRKYIVPNIFAMLGISCYILADTFFISCAAGANGNGITALNLTLSFPAAELFTLLISARFHESDICQNDTERSS